MGKSDNIFEAIKHTRLIPMITVPEPSLTIPIANALLAGGINWIEITFRNEFAEDALKKLKVAKLPLIYGAGTIRTAYQIQKAHETGIKFAVTPGFNDAVAKYAQKLKVPIFPGVDSTLGIEQAQDLGLTILKFFPAVQNGGVEWLKAMQGPYADIQFIPSGGITMKNLKDYLSLKNVIAVSGSFLAPPELIAEKKFDEITSLAKKALAIVKELEP
jgi:2-dehydro-3-deoxyphosphogluconate aldolase / (4S)-4-hydroxy-2-oxoglutarate aldolase